jgi:Cu(I)/Ag(I) efflux system periplasmic protein CusF
MRKTTLMLASCITITAVAFLQTAIAQSTMVEGEVTKIDASAEKITIRHGPIKNLDMEAMSMIFRVQDPTMLKGVKVGDKVKFEADRVNGQITVTKMQRAK